MRNAQVEKAGLSSDDDPTTERNSRPRPTMVKLKLSKAAKKLFSFRERRIDLSETKLNATARELAYVIGAKERFSQD
jgi:hypothetical protein